MKKLCLPLFLLWLTAGLQAQNMLPVVPAPSSAVVQNGKFVLKNNTPVVVKGDQAAVKVAEMLAAKLAVPTGGSYPVKKTAVTGNSIQLQLLTNADTALGSEGYKLVVTPAQITITANQPAGLFYGTQTLLQLLPAAIESKKEVKNISWTIPCATITDKPRFGWRGLMFDVTRHFFTKQEVKQFIDDMVKYKFNMLHLHLTDDQGWRIEIKSLPELTKVGAWRQDRKGKWGNTPAPDSTEPKTYGGFYTHDDIRELVQYAADRFVAIMPEIDVPGHSMAAIATYPELATVPGTYHVNISDKFLVWGSGGSFYAISDNTLNPANEKVYSFLDKVFTEVAQLFPFPYIHMGGDETAKNLWEKSDDIKGLMQREKLKDVHEVQSYFVKRVEKIIESKGKKMMGWDEILEGGLAPNAAVMSWRSMKGGAEAAAQKHPVVMSPAQFAYLDYYQGESTVEPPVYAALRLNKTYQFDPLPAGVDPKYILGGQGNLWTEQLNNFRSVQYMLWPRAMAIAESTWSPKEKKNWDNFVGRVEQQFVRLDSSRTRYARSIYDPIIRTKTDGKDNLTLILEKEVADMDIHYSLNESVPDNYYPVYTKPFVLDKDVMTVRIVTYRNGVQVGKQIIMPLAELKKRAEK
ncbi:beta-N-acetylhexosaminidase [Sediminibacterium ginsengisoli]|uniref:beta-N-acetylhexosaminidase n=1 Tax=Sediminibacterium ginsengisoli TaxID=413434 RepID=A0A1T4R9I4_9BACT|nr:family 20 glycosylhydrolase [Sediminibacterium ginsengisoli]SKA12730.1 hexosaminidase [Sediminibacterium ginsengisoli]